MPMQVVTIETDDEIFIGALCSIARAYKGEQDMVRHAEVHIAPKPLLSQRFDFDQKKLAMELGLFGKDGEFLKEVAECVNKRQDVSLIKVIRKYTGLGIHEAKAVVDRYLLWR